MSVGVVQALGEGSARALRDDRSILQNGADVADATEHLYGYKAG